MTALVPRRYQHELFEQCLQRNTIICADTGVGKTLVACMLMRHLASLPSKPSGRLFAFLVPTVALVDQQSATVESQLPLRVVKFSSAQGIDFWQPDQWLQEIKKADVMVLTPAVLLKMLEHGYIAISQLDLVIFDEAHHARKNHPYKSILETYHREKLRSPTLQLPRIMGMTASPIFSARNAQIDIKNLEAALDSTVVEVKQHRVEYLEACHRPLLTFIQVTPIAVDDIHQSYLESHPPSMKLFERVLDGKGLGRFQVARTLFGPLGQDVFALNFLEARVDHCRAKLPKDDHDILEKTIAGLCQHVEDWQPTLSNCSPKLLMLIEYLLQSQLSELPPQSMIVFCEQRDHAALISRILQCCKRLQPHLRVSYIVGHGETSPIQPIGHKSKEQQVRVADFRSGKLNCIVASQVAEEGLDFRACSLVVRYNLPSTMISLIQSRGRARAANSQLVLFCEGEVEKQKIERFFDDEERSKQFHGQSQDDSDDIELDEPNEDLAVLGVFYPSPSTTTAQITPSTSLRLVNETCQLLPRDEFTLLVKPEYIVEAHDDGYIATLTLPRMKWLPASERVFHSATMASAKSARCHAAFQAVKRLHRRGALDDHLMPIREVDEAANLDASRKRVKLPDPETNEAMPKFVNATAVNPFGSLQGELFLYAVSLSYSITSETTRLGLVCGVSSLTIMPFELDIDGQHCHVSLQPLYQVSWLASGKEFAQVLRFTHAILQAVGDRRHDHETSLWHFIVLLKEASDEIDWDIMNEQISANPSDTEAGEILWAQFNRRLRPSRFLKLIKWRPDLNLENPIPDGTPLYPFDRQTHKFATLRDILTAGLDPPGPGFCCPKDVPEHDPILEAEVLSFPKVGPSSESPSDGVSHTVVLPASVCKRVRIPSQSFALLSAMSHITHNLLSQIQVCQALVRLDLKDTIGLDMAMEALTIPEANCGRDYETLEHVGDAFLKLAVSIHVFNNFNEEAEGYLSKIRSNTTDNRILQKHAQSKNLQASVVCTTVFGSFIQPPKFAKDEIPPDSKLCHQVRGKALADCAEASLGASLCSKGFEAALETAVKLGLSVGGEVPWSLRYTPHPIPTDLNTPPTLYSLEKLLGYHYERPNLALDALRHRSVLSQTSEEACYERLEFLGDAVLDLFVTMWLHHTHPQATAGQLTQLRIVLVSNGSLGYLAITKLQLQKYILRNSPALEKRFVEACELADPIFSEHPYYRAVFMWDPVKVLCDVFESLIGAMIIDVHWNLNKVFEVLLGLFGDTLRALEVDCPSDPWSLLWRNKPPKCKFMDYTLKRGIAADQPCTVNIMLHDQEIASCSHTSRSVAKMSAADLALQALKEESVRDLCDCASNENIEDADESLEITQLCDQEEPEHTRQSNNDDTTSMQTDEEPGL